MYGIRASGVPNGVMGMALNLEEDSVGAVLFGEDSFVHEGDIVKRTGRIMSVPAGNELRGRVVNAIGQPIDGKGPINTKEMRIVDIVALVLLKENPFTNLSRPVLRPLTP